MSEIEFPEYTSLREREDSFKTYHWPPQVKQLASELASAGLFYTGQNDATMCFSCGMGLHKWEVTDVPRDEHARTYPNCPYVRLTMTEDSIKKALEKNKTAKNCEELSIDMVEESETDVIEAMEKGEEAEIPSKTEKECLVCTTTERQVLFQPCGHLATCIGCSFQLKECCCCRRYIKQRLRVYMP